MTIKKISEMAGVSVATVSRVINQNGRFSKETEQRIQRIIKDNNFQPNQLARGLRTNHARVIGIIVPDITNDFFARLTLCIQKRLMKYQYVTIICNTNESTYLEQSHLNMLQSQRISGLIVAGQKLKAHAGFEVPSVYIDRPVYEQHSARGTDALVMVESDNRKGGYLATSELLQKGCRRIGMVCFTKHAPHCNQRFEGYCDALKEAGIPLEENWVRFEDNGKNETGFYATCQLLKSFPQIEGIFYSTDTLAIGGLRAAQTLGLSVPGQLKVVGFDDITVSELVTPSLTTIRQDVDGLAKSAVDCLKALLEGSALPLLKKIDVELIVRESTGEP